MKRLLILTFLGALVLAPRADAATTCRSGHTEYKRNGVRVFSILRHNDDEWYGCGSQTRRPLRLYGAPGGLADFSIEGRSGDKVFFSGQFYGEGGGADTTLGWFDGRTSKMRYGELAGEAGEDPRDVVLAPDGAGIGVVSVQDEEDGDGSVRVGYLARSPRKDELRDEFVLSLAPGYVKGSLAFAGRALSWKLADGATRSVPLAGEAVTCTSGTTVVESDGARVFEVFPNRRTGRGFQTDLLAACDRGATTPRELAVSDVDDLSHWEPRATRPAGSRLLFQAGSTGIGLIDGGTVRFGEPKDVDALQDLAIGATGDPVLAFSTSYGVGAQNLIARWTPGTDQWQPLALQGADLIVDGSLAVGDDGRVRWRSKDGFDQSVPPAGATALDCRSGTTLLDRDGWRVFETVSAEDARLYGCASGATAPLELLKARPDLSWRVIELAREHDRLALFAVPLSSSYRIDAVVSFGVDGAFAGIPGPSVEYGAIRDTAIAPDGRVALALHKGSRWLITAFDGEKERTLATRTDGFQAGSLSFDGTRVSWRNRAGRTVTA